MSQRQRKTADAYVRTTALGRAMVARRGAMTTAELGQSLGFSQSKVSRFERGELLPSLEDARTLARWLGWTLDRLAVAVLGPDPLARGPRPLGRRPIKLKAIREDPDLGRVPDKVLANRYHTTMTLVGRARAEAGIGRANGQPSISRKAGTYHGLIMVDLLGTMSDAELARRCGVTRNAVHLLRVKRGIARYLGPPEDDDHKHKKPPLHPPEGE